MGYTIPTLRTWSEKDFVTASLLNAQVIDPLNLALDPPRCRVRLTSDQSIAHGTGTYITWNQADYDTEPSTAMWAAADSDKVYFRTAGLYHITLKARFGDSGTTYRRIASIHSSTSALSTLALHRYPDGNWSTLITEHLILAAVGDYVRGYVWQDSGAALPLKGVTTDPPHTTMTVTWVGTGSSDAVPALPVPYQWQEGERPTAAQFNEQVRDQMRFLINRPFAFARPTSNFSLTNATAIRVPLHEQVWGNAGMLVASGNTYLTCQVPGIYRCLGQVQGDNTDQDGRRFISLTHRDSSDALQQSFMVCEHAPQSGTLWGLPVQGFFALAQGDRLGLEAYQDSGTTQNGYGSATTLPTFLACRWVRTLPA
jgi:hypothetical protein